jgi:sugar-specific transcriptional regulator TrmB
MPSRYSAKTAQAFADALLSLGFSQYEARCYVGLLGADARTGYAVWKVTGVPQPKVYEALRKLVDRGAARQLTGEPARFLAVPPEQLFDDLQSSFDQRLDKARDAGAKLEVGAQPLDQEPVARLRNRDAILAAAASALAAAGRRVYLSTTAAELEALQQPIQQAVHNGVDIVLLHFGQLPSPLSGVRAFRHASTDGALFRRHQSRHIAVVADSRMAIFGLAPDGRHWTGIQTESDLVIAVVKGYIRHDIDLQQIFQDFGHELTAAYGAGLQQLETYRAEPGSTTSASGKTEDRTGTAQAG